ncbi:MAG: hypothetical protein GQ558_04380 [Thermoplasmata archaeon]|nr:hypothetical protein [Thermoplasmata archaeon]
MDLLDNIWKVVISNKPINVFNLLLKTMTMFIFMIVILYMIPDIGVAFQTYEKNENSPYDWIDNSTLRPPETIITESPTKRSFGDTSLDVSNGQDGSIYIVWESFNNIMFSERPPGSQAFTPPHQLNSPGNQGIEPRVNVGDDGTVHVIWLETKDIPEDGMGSPNGNRLIWLHLGSGDDDWSASSTILTGNISYPKLAVLPDGMISTTVWYRYQIVDENGTTIINGYRLLYLAWSLDGHVSFKRSITQLCPEAIPQQYLFVSKAGNPHILVPENGRTNWYASSDGGQTWLKDTYYIPSNHPGMKQSIVLGGAALDNNNLVYIIGFQSAINQSRYSSGYGYFRRGWGSTYPSWDADYSIAFPIVSIQARNGVVWTSRLIFRDVPSNGGDNNPQQATLLFRTIWFNKTLKNFHTGMEITNVPRDGDYSSFNPKEFSLAISVEENNMPVIALVHPDLTTNSSKIDVWRFNHPPNPPEAVTEARGGWTLSPWVVLASRSSIDIDGDDIEYRISYWMDDNYVPTTTRWTDLPYIIIRASHGTYHWSIEVRDTFNASTGPEEDWWFKADTGPPRSHPGGPYSLTEGSWASLDGRGSYDDGPLVLWEWDFNGDGTFELNSTGPITLKRMPDDYSGILALRVTDEAGRTAISTTHMWVDNVLPSIRIEGFSVVTGPSNYSAIVSDTSPDDTIVVRWSIDGIFMGEGSDFLFEHDGPGVYHIVAMAVDDDGGSNYSLIKVTVPWPERLPLSMETPMVVIEGHVYTSRLSAPPPSWISPQDLEWRREGIPVGKGSEMRFVAGGSGWERIDVGILVEGRFLIGDTMNIRVRERLRPVVCVGADVISYDSVEVRWTTSEQRELFERYVVRISRNPMSLFPSPDLEWMAGPFDAPYEPVEIHTHSKTTHLFQNLDSGWTYHVSIYVIHGAEVSCSNSISVSIPPEPGPLTHEQSDSNENSLSTAVILISLVLFPTLCMIFGYGILMATRRDNNPRN